MSGYTSHCAECGKEIVSDAPLSGRPRAICIPCWRAMRAQPSPQMHAEWLRDLSAWNDGPVHYAASVNAQGDVSPLCERRVIDLEVESWDERADKVTCSGCAALVEKLRTQ